MAVWVGECAKKKDYEDAETRDTLTRHQGAALKDTTVETNHIEKVLPMYWSTLLGIKVLDCWRIRDLVEQRHGPPEKDQWWVVERWYIRREKFRILMRRIWLPPGFTAARNGAWCHSSLSTKMQSSVGIIAATSEESPIRDISNKNLRLTKLGPTYVLF